MLYLPVIIISPKHNTLHDKIYNLYISVVVEGIVDTCVLLIWTMQCVVDRTNLEISKPELAHGFVSKGKVI